MKEIKNQKLLRNKSFINNKWINSLSNKKFSVYNPLDLSLLSSVTECGEKETKKADMDWLGLVLISVFIFALLSALSSGGREGWGSDIIVLYFVITCVALIGFLFWESICRQPMLSLKLFSNVKVVYYPLFGVRVILVYGI